MTRSRILLLIALTLVCGSGAHCIPRRGPEPPRVLPEGPSLAQVMDAVNANTSRVASYSTNHARLSVPGAPSLPTEIALERPRKFRMRSGTGLTGTEVDLGSNDEQFWFWVRRNDPPALYHCRHDQFLQSGARGMLPIEPEWLIESLGLVRFDAAYPHTGPFPGRDNRLEIHSSLPGPDGASTKVTVIDALRGYVVEQHLYNSRGERLASSIASEHRYDPLTQVTLPTHIELQIPRAQMYLTLETGAYQLNTLAGASPDLWAKPTYDGYPEVDLGRPPTAPPTAALPAAPLQRTPLVIPR